MIAEDRIRRRTIRFGYTLVETLIVVIINVILAAILLPVLIEAKEAAKKIVCISNLRQIGFATTLYITDNEAYPPHSSPPDTVPRARWPDHVQMYAKSEAVFECPNAPRELLQKPWAHLPQRKYGGYGYNYQYLGNSRLLYTAYESEIEFPSQAIMIADSNGVRKDDDSLAGGEYVIDPPLPSSRGSGRASGFYNDPPNCGSGGFGAGIFGCRAVPVERHGKSVAIIFADGHARTLKRRRMDDFDRNGLPDNGWYNGRADASVQ